MTPGREYSLQSGLQRGGGASNIGSHTLGGAENFFGHFWEIASNMPCGACRLHPVFDASFNFRNLCLHSSVKCFIQKLALMFQCGVLHFKTGIAFRIVRLMWCITYFSPLWASKWVRHPWQPHKEMYQKANSAVKIEL